MSTFDTFLSRSSTSLLDSLNIDPESELRAPNRESREVFSGHYVLVDPTPLPDPKLVALSPQLLRELRIDRSDVENNEKFLRIFSADGPRVAAKEEFGGVAWATPYALTIYGQEMTRQCIFGTGNGYGDGRAASVGEVVIPETGKRWEFQLKGSGTTPFSRNADGRAVLRSSVREFLAEETMHALGISTTRALCLIVSGTETVDRPWYDGKSFRELGVPTSVDDPRLRRFRPEDRAEVIKHIAMQASSPNIMQKTRTAIATRVAPSFLRVGQIELFARRVRAAVAPDDRLMRTRELRQIVVHLLEREYADIDEKQYIEVALSDLRGKSESEQQQAKEKRSEHGNRSNVELQSAILGMLQEFSSRMAAMTTGWMRVGFVQGNFNSDNCLAGGRTMDYGPFGFMQSFERGWNMWTNGGAHFAYWNQPRAGYVNFSSLVRAVQPLLEPAGRAAAQSILESYLPLSKRSMKEMWRQKLGLTAAQCEEEVVDELVEDLLDRMEKHSVDFTILFRNLPRVLEAGVGSTSESKATLEISNAKIIDSLGTFSSTTCAANLQQVHDDFVDWVRKWIPVVVSEPVTTPEGASSNGTGNDIASRITEACSTMRKASPKYVPREEMFVAAYEAANKDDYTVFNELHQLLTKPYDEQPKFEAQQDKYFRPAVRSGPGFTTMS